MICERITKLVYINKSVKSHEIKYLLDDLTMNWDEVSRLLSNFIAVEVLESYDDCLRCKRLIDPILDECQQRALVDPATFRRTLKENSCWTHSTSEVLDVYDEVCFDPTNNSVQATLRLTSLLEFALGNVFKTFTRGRLPPHLYKELLQELAELENVFEPNQIFLLQLILGSSKGVNLRNFVWHGFVESVDPAYVCFLLVIIVSYGKQLIQPIVSRLRLDIDLTTAVVFDAQLDLNVLLKSPIIKQNNFKSWQQIAKCYSNGNLKSAIFLLLSQIESLLRFIYGQVNQVDVTARLDKYYVIMDSIFYEYILGEDCSPLVIGKISRQQELVMSRNNKRNKILELFPSSLIYLGYDLFQAVDGPRIRDKISHGETTIGDVKQVTDKLLQFAMLVVEFSDNDRGKLSNFDYRSVYMNNFKLIKNYNEACILLRETFDTLSIPETLKLENSNFAMSSSMLKISDDKSVENFFRPFSEKQIVKLMLNILENVDIAMKNFLITCNVFFEHYIDRKLGTSRRQSLRHLVESLPNFYQGFLSLLNGIAEIFPTIQLMRVDDDDENFGKNSIKYLKLSLRFTENIAKNFSLEGRNFFVANQKTCDFLQLTDKCKHLLTRQAT